MPCAFVFIQMDATVLWTSQHFPRSWRSTKRLEVYQVLQKLQFYSLHSSQFKFKWWHLKKTSFCSETELWQFCLTSFFFSEKHTSRAASAAYMTVVDNSYVGSSDEVSLNHMFAIFTASIMIISSFYFLWWFFLCVCIKIYICKRRRYIMQRSFFNILFIFTWPLSQHEWSSGVIFLISRISIYRPRHFNLKKRTQIYNLQIMWPYKDTFSELHRFIDAFSKV